MIRILVVFFITFIYLEALDYKSYEKARELQKQNNKLIMIDVIRTNCHYCETMEKEVLQDKEMSAWLEERFIPVKLNLDHEMLPLGIKVNFTPSFFFIDKDEKIIKQIPGAWDIEDFQSMTKDLK